MVGLLLARADAGQAGADWFMWRCCGLWLRLQPEGLLREAYRILSHGGRLGIMHWNYDPATPRGPSMDIRPRPEQCRNWAQDAGFRIQVFNKIDLPPYHYGWAMEKP